MPKPDFDPEHYCIVRGCPFVPSHRHTGYCRAHFAEHLATLKLRRQNRFKLGRYYKGKWFRD